jgi:hypothetical protein
MYLCLEALEGRCLPSFITAPAYPAGSNAYAVAVKDFNGDGRVDMAVVNDYASGTVTILKGNPDGSFKPAGSFPVGSYPTALVAADLNGDGKADLAVANSGTNTVSVLLGNGDGTFHAQVAYVVGVRPRAIVAGDFDKDGDLDLATANYGTNYHGSVTVLKNSGSGTFTTNLIESLAMEGRGLVAGDFDNNGDLDLVVVGYTYDWDLSYCETPVMQVLTGHGDGSFTTGATYHADFSPSQVVAGDFDGNGDLDLAVANAFYGTVSVWLGNGNGTFVQKGSYTGAWATAGDFNGDGRPDLFTTERNGSLSLFQGAGDGTFGPPANYVAGAATWVTAAADLDGDGDLDLVIPNATNSGTVTVMRNTGNGFAPALPMYGTGGIEHFTLVSADFNKDGTADLAVANDNNVAIFLAKADGTLGGPATYPAQSDVVALVAADVNRDGFPDLVVSNSKSKSVSVLVNKGDGTFLPAKNFGLGAYTGSVAVADFTGDGIPDIAVVAGGMVAVLRGTGTGRFRAPVTYAAGYGLDALQAGDFNGDGHEDLAVANCGGNSCSSQVTILLNSGNGAFYTAGAYPTGVGGSSLALADFNGDGALDLAVANRYYGTTVSLLLGNGDGTFQPRVTYGAGNQPYAPVVTDVNRDGKLDVVVASDGGMQVLLGNGDGSFQAPQGTAVGPAATGVAAGDFNADGWPDVALCLHYAGGFVVLANAAGWPPGPPAGDIRLPIGAVPASGAPAPAFGNSRPPPAVGAPRQPEPGLAPTPNVKATQGWRLPASAHALPGYAGWPTRSEPDAGPFTDVWALADGRRPIELSAPRP